jgi:hypothetical protein
MTTQVTGEFFTRPFSVANPSPSVANANSRPGIASANPGSVFTVSESAFQVLWEYLGLPDMPDALAISPYGLGEREREAWITNAWTELQRGGMADSATPHPRLAALLGVLARPARSVDAKLWLGAPVRAFAASNADKAAFAVLVDGYVNVHAISPGDLARAPVSLLLDAAPGQGCEVSLPVDVIADTRWSARHREGGHHASDDVPVQARLAGSPEATWLAEMIYGADDRGVFTAGVTDHLGYVHRPDRSLGFFDSPNGRYLIEESRAADGRDWIYVGPTTARLMVERVERSLLILGQRARLAERSTSFVD